MTQFPRIYSLCTVGVRQHYNANYLLHSVRTDFTGDNGLGKSIISDLIQLIFIPSREEWKPGTEGLKKEERKIETIPIEREWVKHAFSILNIEMRDGKYITIGVLISRKKVPVRPFIIQKNPDFENSKKLIPFDFPLVFNDFLTETGSILELNDVARNLLSKHSIFLKPFQDLQDYYDLLYNNSIIPIQLKNKNNLRSFAKVLQSFSRGKTLDITKSASLQNFLFEDDEEIRVSFEKEKEALSGYIRDYHRNSIQIDQIEKKQQRLTNLSHCHKSFEEAREEYLKKNALYCHNIFLLAKKENDDNSIKYSNAIAKITETNKEVEKVNIGILTKLIEQKQVCELIQDHILVMVEESSENKTNELKVKKDNATDKLRELQKLQPLINEYGTIDNIYKNVLTHKKLQEDASKLTNLKAIKHYKEFENSPWTQDYKVALNKYTDRQYEINKRLIELEGLLSLFDGSRPDSLFSWAVNRKKTLTLEQESILMHLKSISVKKLQAEEGFKYTTTPESLLNSYKSDKSGLWLILGDIFEYIPFVGNQLFTNTGILEEAVSRNRDAILKEINYLKEEYAIADLLFTELQEIGYSNEDYVKIYKDRINIESFKLNPLLTTENCNFIRDNFDKFDSISILEKEVELLNIEYDRLISNRGAASEKKSNIEKEISELENNIAQFPSTEPFEVDQLDYSMTLEELEDLKINLKRTEKELVDIIARHNNTIWTQIGIRESASKVSGNLTEAMSSAEAQFLSARTKLEADTSIKFNDLFPDKTLDSLIIYNLKQSFDTAENLYRNNYLIVASEFEESSPSKKSPELYNKEGEPYFSYKTLVNVLCGKVGLEGLTYELKGLNEKRKEFGKLQLEILTTVFDKVAKQYNEYDNTIIRLNQFFSNNLVSQAYKFKIEFTPRQDISIDWIEKMKTSVYVYKHGPDLFNPQIEETPEELITNIAKSFYRSLKCEPRELLDPKFYFNLSVRMENDEGIKNTGSGGQTYTALALLCIGRLSIVQKQNRQGVKFIIIEELSNIDDKNFNLFPQIAKKFGYQLITMTPKPFGSYTDEEWYLHMLNRTKEIDRNYAPMSFFKSNFKSVELNEYISNELERTEGAK